MFRRFRVIRFVVWDFIAAFAAWVFFYYFRKQLLDEQWFGISFKALLGGAVVGLYWLFVYQISGYYTDLIRRSRLKETLSLISTTMLGSIVLFFAFFLDDGIGQNHLMYYKTFGSYLIIHYVFSTINRIVLIGFTKRLIKQGKVYFNTLIIGSNTFSHELYSDLKEVNHLLGFRFVAYIHTPNSNMSFPNGLRHLGGIENISKVIRRCKIEQVIVALEPTEKELFYSLLQEIDGFDVRINIIPDLYRWVIGQVKVNQLMGISLIEIRKELMPEWQWTVKRMIDISVSVLVLLLGSPVYVLVGVLTKLSSPGPVFFTQERIGLHEKPFNIIKFRSMYVNAEKDGPALSSTVDSRITPWGKFMRKTRLDEIPQFFNVLKGDMSLVGPRPERRFFIDKIVNEAPYYRHLFKVRPGITSLGQVKFGYAENVDQMIRRLKYDILYIENLSLAMDMRIIMNTILVVFQGKGK